MSRTRQSSQYGNNRVRRLSDGNLYDEFSYRSPLLGTFGDFYEQAYSRSSVITDDPDSNNRGYKDISHVHQRCEPMKLISPLSFNYGGYAPPASFDMVGQCRSFASYPEPSPGSADWGSMIAQLADSLDGQINTGCLALVTLKELGSTIKMVRNPFNLLKGNWRFTAGLKSAAQLAKAGANIFLEGQYGWKAAYNDVRNFANAYKELSNLPGVLEEEDPRLSFAQKDELSWSGGGVYYRNTWDAQWIWWTQTASKQTREMFDCKEMQKISLSGKITYVLGCRQNLVLAQRLSMMRRVSNAIGTDVSSLLPTLWEIVPYSFVVDWFINWQAILGWSKRGRLMRSDVYNIGYSSKRKIYVDIEETVNSRSALFYYRAGPWYRVTPYAHTGVPVIKGRTIITDYYRERGVPLMGDITTSLINANLNPTQLASGISLAVQRAVK